MNQDGKSDPCRIGDVTAVVVERLRPLYVQYDSVTEAWDSLLPSGLRRRCRISGIRNGCLKVLVDGSSYVYELQLCKAALLRELQDSCPAARLQRIEVGVAR